ncbi:MAG: MarR family transcriptional regulator [Burkholderiales bacterium]|nr:MarR family transcriptional regulator [Burkholderiales bacterium]
MSSATVQPAPRRRARGKPATPAAATIAAPVAAPVTAPKPALPAAATAGTPARVLRRFRQVFTAVRSHFQKVEKQVGIGGAQVWALGVIAEQPGLAVGSLARAMHIHQSTASNLVRGLVERGLVQTERGAADRRTVYLRLQPAGTELLARAPAPHAGVLLQALRELDPATLAQLEADLARLLQQMGVPEDAPAVPIG